jgi:hypothetical protein
MNQERDEYLATEFLLRETGSKLKLIGSRKWSKRPDEWNVLFETVDQAGKSVDGPSIVIVDERTASARFFEK